MSLSEEKKQIVKNFITSCLNEGISIDEAEDLAAHLVKNWELEFLDVDHMYNEVLSLREKNNRLYDALNYVYESGCLRCEVDQKARWGLGLYVENPEEVAKLQPKDSH